MCFKNILLIAVLSIGTFGLGTTQSFGQLADTTINYSNVDTTKMLKGSLSVLNLTVDSQILPENPLDIEVLYSITIDFDLPNGSQSSKILVEIGNPLKHTVHFQNVYDYQDLVTANKVIGKHVNFNNICSLVEGAYTVSVTLQYPYGRQANTVTQNFNL